MSIDIWALTIHTSLYFNYLIIYMIIYPNLYLVLINEFKVSIIIISISFVNTKIPKWRFYRARDLRGARLVNIGRVNWSAAALAPPPSHARKRCA